jgi:hypothetical protein
MLEGGFVLRRALFALVRRLRRECVQLRSRHGAIYRQYSPGRERALRRKRRMVCVQGSHCTLPHSVLPQLTA